MIRFEKLPKPVVRNIFDVVVTGISRSRYRRCNAISTWQRRLVKKEEDWRLSSFVFIIGSYVRTERAWDCIHTFPVNDGNAPVQVLEG
jgi:hypothetical protein